MRTFIAIELPHEIRNFLSGIQGKLKAKGADVKWVEPQNIHLTLKFLGEIDEEKMEMFNQILEESVRDKSSFYMRLSSIGAFPKINFPRVIWVGIDKGDAETHEIAKVLEEKLIKIGVPSESRPFSSHITIGRVRTGLNREKLTDELNNLKQKDLAQENLEFLVSKITLFKSTLTPKGPVYEALKEENLRAS